MLWLIFMILVIVWLFGVISGVLINGFIHLLLVIAVIVLIVRITRGRRVP